MDPVYSVWLKTLKNLALVLLFSGFGLLLGGAIADRRAVLEIGQYAFIVGIALLLFGLFCGRRKP